MRQPACASSSRPTDAGSFSSERLPSKVRRGSLRQFENNGYEGNCQPWLTAYFAALPPSPRQMIPPPPGAIIVARCRARACLGWP